MIDRPPERIIWCYSQWQNAYKQLLMMIPTIEFVKGIPESLENDTYLDVNIKFFEQHLFIHFLGLVYLNNFRL